MIIFKIFLVLLWILIGIIGFGLAILLILNIYDEIREKIKEYKEQKTMNKQAIKHRLELLDKNLKEIGFTKTTKWTYGKGNIKIWLSPDNTFDVDIVQGGDMIVSHKKYDITKIDGSEFLIFFSDLRKFVVLFEKLFLKE